MHLQPATSFVLEAKAERVMMGQYVVNRLLQQHPIQRLIHFKEPGLIPVVRSHKVLLEEPMLDRRELDSASYCRLLSFNRLRGSHNCR